ncbi:MAG: ComEC family competence protein, partial [Candidatus Rokubacteria bacterium]|nr:ComEC family competence protein [Candidatus Rokubacteria bacterium]
MGLKRAPLVPVAVAFAAGLALAPVAPGALAWTAWLAALAATGALLALGRARWAAAPLLAGVVAVGALRGAEPPLAADHVARLPLPRTARVEGRLAAEPRRWAPDRARLLLDAERADGVPVTGRIQVSVYGEAPPLAEGQRVSAELRLHPAIGFRNPGGFDHAAALAREGIRVVATARADRLEALEAPRPPWPARVRREAVAAIGRALPPASGALLAGLLLGDRTGLPRDLDDGFRRAGVYHVLAVSGFNVALIAAAVWT